MKYTRRFATALAAAAFTSTSLLGVGIAGAAELSPADVQGEAQLATISTEVAPVAEGDPSWRKLVADRAKTDSRIAEYTVTSPAMAGRKIPVVVLKAETADSPTLYLLNGAGGGEQSSTDWITQTNVLDFYRDKNVNVVIPMAGKFSYYTDWNENTSSLDGETGAKQMWETFLTKELPGAIEAKLDANNDRAIAGMSMSATSSLLLAQHNQGFYDAVGSFSGCAATSSILPYEFMRVTLERGNATPEQMWGPRGSQTNLYNDAIVGADKLAGTAIYVSNGTGLVGETDTAGYLAQTKGLDSATALAGSSVLTVEGGAIEAATNACTHALKAKLDSLDIPSTFNFHPVGTHTWSYWEDDLAGSWSVIGPAIGR